MRTSQMEKHVKNTTMAKFEAPGIKDCDVMTICIFKKLRGFVWKKLLEGSRCNFPFRKQAMPFSQHLKKNFNSQRIFLY